jgi:uncharacterized protein YcfJ
MATNIGSLASGLDGHAIGLGDGRKELRKHGDLAIFFFGELAFPL